MLTQETKPSNCTSVVFAQLLSNMDDIHGLLLIDLLVHSVDESSNICLGQVRQHFVHSTLCTLKYNVYIYRET